eukprot:Skav220489  [mRNA]  locus=scaffold591:193687:195261:+ [translate_table: standard]
MHDESRTTEDYVSKPVSHERSLTPKVPANLVRGVPFRRLLVRCGRTFRTSTSRVEETRHSRLCSRFDIFVSHDWGTSPWLKYAALLVLFNSHAAAIATLVASTATGILIACEIVPYSKFAIFIGYLTFGVFFFFWQNIRDIFCAPRLAFLDKLTIPQDDEQVKEQCILALAGFLERSRKLVILFSEAYTGRLWCIYEFTAFMRMHATQSDVQALPVYLPLLLILHAAWWLAVKLLGFLVYHVLPPMSEGSQMLLSVSGIAVMFLITYPLQHWVGRRLTMNLQSLVGQLRDFDVNTSKCACCSAEHVKETGEKIPCDRELIYQSLTDWYGNESADLEVALENFNLAVRSHLADQILSTWGKQSIPIRLFISIVFSMNTPFLISRIPLALAQQSSAFLAAAVIRDLVPNWGSVFPAMLFYLWACKMSWTLALNHRLPSLTLMVSAVLVCSSTAMAGGLCVSAVLLTSEDTWLPALLAFVLVTALGLCLLRVFTIPMDAGRKIEDEIQGDGKVNADSIRDDLSSFSI